MRPIRPEVIKLKETEGTSGIQLQKQQSIWLRLLKQQQMKEEEEVQDEDEDEEQRTQEITFNVGSFLMLQLCQICVLTITKVFVHRVATHVFLWQDSTNTPQGTQIVYIYDLISNCTAREKRVMHYAPASERTSVQIFRRTADWREWVGEGWGGGRMSQR